MRHAHRGMRAINAWMSGRSCTRAFSIGAGMRLCQNWVAAGRYQHDEIDRDTNPARERSPRFSFIMLTQLSKKRRASPVVNPNPHTARALVSPSRSFVVMRSASCYSVRICVEMAAFDPGFENATAAVLERNGLIPR